MSDLAEHNARLKELNDQAQREYEQRLIDANKRVEEFYATVTQREWILLQRQLDATREEIGADQGLTLLGYAWVTEKRERGGAEWDRLLDMTDDELLAETQFPTAPAPITEVPGDVEHDAAEAPGEVAAVEVPQTSESPVTGS